MYICILNTINYTCVKIYSKDITTNILHAVAIVTMITMLFIVEKLENNCYVQ